MGVGQIYQQLKTLPRILAKPLLSAPTVQQKDMLQVSLSSDAYGNERTVNSAGREKGIALVIAILVISMVMIFSVDMIVNSAVNIKLISRQRNKVKAEYTAKSGQNIAIFLTVADLAIDLVTYRIGGKKELPTDGRGNDLWNLLNDFPIGGKESEIFAKFVDQFEIEKQGNGKVAEILSRIDGQFVINVEDETKKININQCLAGVASKQCELLMLSLFSCPAERLFLEKRDVTPEQLVANLIDYGDENTTPNSTEYSSENAPYDTLRLGDREPKNFFYFSVDELRKVPGWTDDVHTVFSKYFTVHPLPETTETPRINFNSADQSFLICLSGTYGNRECIERVVGNLNPDTNATLDPVSSQGGIKEWLEKVACAQPAEDQVKRESWFGFRSDTYRIRVEAQLDDQVRTIDSVLERFVPDPQRKFKDYTASYKFLYWKMM